MIHPDDVAAWLAQVRQNPEAAPGIIEALSARLMELDKQNEALRDELVRLSRSREPAPDEGRVATLARRVQALERQLGQTEASARSFVVLTLDGRGARLPVPDVGVWQGREDQSLVASHLRSRHLIVAADEGELLLFTDKGRAVRVDVADVGAEDVPTNYLSLFPGLTLDLDEAVSAVISLPAAFSQLLLVTRKGYARSFRHAEVDSLLERNLPLHSSPIAGDYPAFVLLGDGTGELLIATRMGKGVRIPERVVGVQSLPAIKLDRGDVVAGAAVVGDETVLLIVSEEGFAVRREMSGFGAHSTAGNRGKILARIEHLVAVAPVTKDDVFWLLSSTGELKPVSAAQVPSGPGASSGKTVARLGEDRVVAMAVA
jgi:DNA gyrase/topoisomerase IV subunit A